MSTEQCKLSVKIQMIFQYFEAKTLQDRVLITLKSYNPPIINGEAEGFCSLLLAEQAEGVLNGTSQVIRRDKIKMERGIGEKGCRHKP